MSETLNYRSDPYALAYPETESFWDAAENDNFLLKTCGDCGKAHWYPRIICPLCGSDNTSWKSASGRGTVYSYSEMQRTETPYVLAYVQLEEGPIMMTNLIDYDPATLKIGTPVQVLFQRTPDGRKMPVFKPAT